MPKQPLTKYRFGEPEFTAYAAGCSSLPLPGAPFSSMMCEVAPGAETEAHNHAEPEAIVVVSGRAEVRSGDRVGTVAAGEAVVLEPYGAHVLTNPSDTDPLRFVSVYWMPPAAELAAADEATAVGVAATRQDTVVISTPPTPNGALHLGHFAGPYLAGDILRRRLSTADSPVTHLSGFDDHTSYVWTKARRLGEEPERLAARFVERIRRSWAAMGVAIDAPDNPYRDPGYQRFCADVVAALHAGGHVVARRAPALYDKESGRYLHEALVSGGCPYCGSTSDGDACEECGRPHEAPDLVDPVATLSPGSPVETRPGTFLYFRLEPHRRFLDQHLRTGRMSDRAAVLGRTMLAGELPDIRISHDVEWGVPVSADGVVGQRLYPWFEMALYYLWTLRATLGPDSLRVEDGRLVVSDRLRDLRIVHCFGFDNCYFHTLLFPAVYHALDERLPVPADFVVNELLRLDGSKFSTSRDHVISAEQILAHVDVDLVRWYLAAIRPETSATNFTLADLRDRVDRELVAPLNDLMGRFVAVTRDAFDGALPEPGGWTGATTRYHRTLGRLTRIVDEALDVPGFSPPRALDALRRVVAETVELLAGAARLAEVPALRDQVRTSVALAAVGVTVVGHYLGMVAPGVGARMRAVLPAGGGPTVLDFRPPGEPVAAAWSPLKPVDVSGLGSG